MEPETVTEPTRPKSPPRKRWMWCVLLLIVAMICATAFLMLTQNGDTEEDLLPLPDGFGLV